MLTSTTANVNRDPKNKKEPYGYLDFSFYKPAINPHMPGPEASAAYHELVKLKQLPGWALTYHSQMKANLGIVNPPEPLAVRDDNIILLCPVETTEGLTGTLINAQEDINGKIVLRSLDETTSWLVEIGEKQFGVDIKENVTLPIIRKMRLK